MARASAMAAPEASAAAGNGSLGDGEVFAAASMGDGLAAQRSFAATGSTHGTCIAACETAALSLETEAQCDPAWASCDTSKSPREQAVQPNQRCKFRIMQSNDNRALTEFLHLSKIRVESQPVIGSMKTALLALLASSSTAFAQVSVINAWSPATAPGAQVAAGYAAIRNGAAAPDRLRGAESPVAARVEMHVATMESNIMRMRQAQSLELPARGGLELKPGAAHLMFVDIKRPFKEGDKVPVTLHFERGGDVTAEFQVGRLGAASHSH